MLPLDRRQFLTLSATTLGGFLLHRAGAVEAVATPSAQSFTGASFFLVGDTHYLASASDPAELDPVSRGYNERVIGWLNRLPGSELPATVGGGPLPMPDGVIHAGDLIDSGDKPGAERAQRTEMEAWEAAFGLAGGDGRLLLPVREVHGNHDSPSGEGFVIERLRERTKVRPGLANVSPNGLHYSWDWAGVHFVNLGILVGRENGAARARRFAPLGSLDFLIADLAGQVGESGRPIVLTHHVDVARYSLPPEAPTAGKGEWDAAEVRAYFEALRPYRIAAILYGHTHTRRVFPWDGTLPTEPPASSEGIPVFNTDNAAHFKWEEQAFFHLQVSGSSVIAREFATGDGWQTGAWTPQVWRFPLQ